MPDISPGQMAFHQKNAVSLRARFGAPAGFERAYTAPESTPAYRRYQRKRSLTGSPWARLGRANRHPQLRRLPP